MKTFTLSLLLLLLIPLLSANTFSIVEIDGMIADGYLSLLEREVDRSIEHNYTALIIMLNTPGGLVSTTQKINELILNAKIPIIVYVHPSGAMAASAGSFLVLASDIAAMTPATTMGAAQPISITPEGVEDAGEKTRNFLSEQAKSLAEEKKRPGDIAKMFVESNLALTAQEALEKGVIEYIATDIDDLMQQINDVVIEKKGNSYTVISDNYVLDYRYLKTREIFQQWLSNPQTAMLFLMLGLMGLYVGFTTPGTLVPEVLGGIMFILGVYGLGMFETNIIGIILVLTGISLIIAEFFTSGFGIMGIGGLISLIIGAILLPVEPLMGVDWYGTFIRTVIGFGIGIGIIMVFIVQKVIHSLKHPEDSKTNLNIPKTGITIESLSPTGMIKANGELWKAKSSDNRPIENNSLVKIVGKDSSWLLVVKTNQEETE